MSSAELLLRHVSVSTAAMLLCVASLIVLTCLHARPRPRQAEGAQHAREVAAAGSLARRGLLGRSRRCLRRAGRGHYAGHCPWFEKFAPAAARLFFFLFFLGPSSLTYRSAEALTF